MKPRPVTESESAYIRAHFLCRKGKLFKLVPVGIVPTNERPYPQVKITVDGVSKSFVVSRVLFFLALGFWPETVDHKDGDTRNNRRGNLRAASMHQQSFNRKKRKDSDQSLPVGVVHYGGSGGFLAYIRCGSIKRKRYFPRGGREDAISWRQEQERILHKEFGASFRTTKTLGLCSRSGA